MNRYASCGGAGSSALLLALLAAAACEVRDAESKPGLWTLIELEAAAATDANVAQGATFPSGVGAAAFLEENGDGTCRPRVLPAFAEGQAAAYVVPEVWSHYREVWVQPWYVLVTAWDDKNPFANRLKDADGKPTLPIYDVDTASTFYSPFWKIIFVEVPPGTATDQYRSSKDIFDARLRLHDGPGWIYSIRPDSVTLGEGKMMHPLVGTEVGNMSLGAGAWFEGEKKSFLNLGGNNFRFDDALVVEEVPLYWFVRRGAAAASGLELPAVVGSGRPYARRPAEVVGTRPRFGGLCRLTLAALPPTAGAFDPDRDVAAAEKLTAAQIDPRLYRGRVALNAVKVAMTDVACFVEPTFPAACVWLDSQAAIEDRLGAPNLTPTEIIMTCPFVSYAGKAVR